MKRLKTYIKMELAVLAALVLGVLILQLFTRNQIDNYEEKIIAFRGSLESKEIEVADFDKFYGSTNIKISLVKGDPKVVITSAPEVIENIEITEDNGWLEIRDKEHDLRIDNELRNASLITVYYEDLSELRSDKNCSVRQEGMLDNRTVKLISEGNSVLTVEVDVEKLTAESAGNSHMTISGEADTLSISSNGNSTLMTKACLARVANAVSNGNSTLKCKAELELEGHANGNSSLHVLGSPVKKNTSSSQNARIVNF